ncbi:MAG: VCBS repeat-containing protein [Rhodobacteraceae bacterium]|nr:MAG: VCBS repeat-containing protein [Paracoccaceae bacterium]
MWRPAALLALLAAPAAAEDIASARYDAPTTRYAHGVLGDAVEWGALVMTGRSGQVFRLTLPESRVFEDTAPRVVDVDGDGDNEVVVVESDLSRGARLSIYDTGGLVAANDFIGRPNRWLAPVGNGAADLDGDGLVEFVYVDRPHLAKTLLVFRRNGERLIQVGALEGYTNHRIGESDIAGGIRDCGQGPEMIVATADWSRVVSVTFRGGQFATRDLAAHQGRETFRDALTCRI